MVGKTQRPDNTQEKPELRKKLRLSKKKSYKSHAEGPVTFTSVHLLNILQPPNIVPPAEKQVPNTKASGGLFTFKAHTGCHENKLLYHTPLPRPQSKGPINYNTSKTESSIVSFYQLSSVFVMEGW